MKAYLVFLFVLGISPAFAQSESSTTATGKTIVIQESPGKVLGVPKVFVESGSEEIAGSPESGLKPAYRQWENRCKEWKSELRQMNGNNLMFASCGVPKKTSEKIQSETIYTYSSKATYKIKVVGK